jgi:hypothetical protein
VIAGVNVEPLGFDRRDLTVRQKTSLLTWVMEENETGIASILVGVEWAVTKTTTVDLSAVVLTTAKSLATQHPELGQAVIVRALQPSEAVLWLRTSSAQPSKVLAPLKCTTAKKDSVLSGKMAGERMSLFMPRRLTAPG